MLQKLYTPVRRSDRLIGRTLVAAVADSGGTMYRSFLVSEPLQDMHRDSE